MVQRAIGADGMIVAHRTERQKAEGRMQAPPAADDHR